MRLKKNKYAPPAHSSRRNTYEPMHGLRIRMLSLLMMAVIGAYGAQIYKLTVLKGPYYFDLSENNFLSETVLISPRGRIEDRNGKPLALNRISYDVMMSPFRLKKTEIDNTITQVSQLVDRPQIADKSERVKKMRNIWMSEELASGLELAVVIPVLEQVSQLPGIVDQRNYQRIYPEGEAAGHITGFVGGIPSQLLPDFRERGYQRNERVGLLGIERAFEEQLHGDQGKEIVWRDRLGQPREKHVAKPAAPGHNLRLTLDLELQRLSYALLEGWRGAIVVMEVKTGRVLAMAGNPSYDPNQPGNLNRGLRSQIDPVTGVHSAPGSVFKVITASAGLKAGYSPDEIINCTGSFRLPKVRRPYRCHRRWGHEELDLSGALERSCNVYFYTWAHRLGPERLVEMAHAYGFGEPTGIEYASFEDAGVLADPSVDTIYAGNVLHMGIGQGLMIEVTPVQVARAYAALANGGHLLKPRIIEEITQTDGKLVHKSETEVIRDLPVNRAQRQAIINGLIQVVEGVSGTARHAEFPKEWKVAGKTSTAQTGREISDAWFAGFAPYDDPEYVVVVKLREAGSGGRMAGPVARQVFAMCFGQPEPEIRPAVLETEEQVASAQ